MQAPAGLIDGAAVTHGREHILQRAPCAHVHVHIAGGHRGYAAALGERAPVRELRAIIGPAMQLHGQPAAIAEKIAQPCRVRLARLRRGHPQRQAIGRGHSRNPIARHPVLALFGAAAAEGDQLADLAVGGLRGRQQHQLHAADRA